MSGRGGTSLFVKFCPFLYSKIWKRHQQGFRDTCFSAVGKHLLYLIPHTIYPILDWRISIHPFSFRLFVCNAQDTPPWILKRGGLESCGWRIISFNGKTKIKSFFCVIFFKNIIIIFFYFYILVLFSKLLRVLLKVT